VSDLRGCHDPQIPRAYPVDEHTKTEASAALAAIALTVSDAFRMMMVRIAREKALPFEPLVPNPKAVDAVREAVGASCPASRRLTPL
jgi:DNA-damage-inducible protein J